MRLFFILIILFTLNRLNAQDTLNPTVFNEEAFPVLSPYKLQTPVYSFVYEDYDKSFLTYVSYKPLKDTAPEKDLLVNVVDYMDCLSILDYMLDTGKYEIKVYLENETNPLKKGELWIESTYAVLKKN